MSGGKILVVEDDELVAELLCQLLEIAGFSTHAAATGADGIAQCRSWHPDAVVLDLMLPDINGFEVCQTIKHDPATRGIDVLLLTAAVGAVHRVRAFASGVDRFMNKPFQPDDIVRELRALINRDEAARAEGELHQSSTVIADVAALSALMPQLEATLFHTTPLATEELEEVCANIDALAKAFFAAQGPATATGVEVSLRILREEVAISLAPACAMSGFMWTDVLAAYLPVQWLSELPKGDTIDKVGNGSRLVYRRRLLPNDSSATGEFASGPRAADNPL